MPAFEFIDQKENQAVALPTRDWDLVAPQIRERAFFMAGVENAKILQSFRDAARRVVMGRATVTEARKELRQALQAMGYQAAEGEQDTIHDLMSRRRMQVTLNTNIEMAHGWAARHAQLDDPAHPAQELYRQRNAAHPRDWEARWREAAEAVNWEGVATNGQMIALLLSPIWRALSRFGQPYPPFDWGSHMWTRPVDLETCRQIGLIPKDATPQDLEQLTTSDREDSVRARHASMNEDVSAIISAFDADIQQALKETLAPIATETAPGKLTMDDVNGTSSKSAQELARILEKGKNTPFGEELRQDLENWVQDSSAYDMPGNMKTSQKFLGLEARARMQALLLRSKPIKPTAPLFRGLNLSAEDFKGFERDIRKTGTTGPLAKKLGESYSFNPENARRFASNGPGEYEVIIECRKSSSGRDLRPFYKIVNPPKENPKKPLACEAEVIFMQGTRFKVLDRRTEKRPNGRTRVFYTVEEVKRPDS